MITILEHGKMGETKTTVCDKCGCKFSFTRDDCYWYRPLLTYIVDCPECKNEIYLENIFDE